MGLCIWNQWRQAWGFEFVICHFYLRKQNIYEARTRHQRCRTRVGRGATRQCGRDTAARVMPRGFFVFLVDLCQLAPMQLWLRPYRSKLPFRAKTAKIQKKERHRTHRLSQIWNPTEDPFHTNTVNLALCLSHSISLVSHSLCALISAFVSACCDSMRHSAWVSHITCGLYLIYEHHVYYCS